MPQGKDWVTVHVNPRISERIALLFSTYGTKAAFINSCFEQAVLFMERQEKQQNTAFYLTDERGLRRELGKDLIKEIIGEGREKK